MTTPRQEELLESEFRQFEPLPKARKDADPEALFAEQCRVYHLPVFEQQHKFAKCIGRQWRFDFAFPAFRVAVEIDGVVMRKVNGAWVTGGRHATVQGMRDDNEKINTAILLGWSVLRFLQSDIKSHNAIKSAMRVLMVRGWKPLAGVDSYSEKEASNGK